ncbi:MAG: helix-turn-helix domain-containing protein [Bacteroidales bacterium]|jgi:AcrR family transcriptional regulator|nr:helix-turn-helix domain-containing protein [Bacteroidales bacterium]MDY6427558.1 helix-turn-helix domain-containing protein [Bacteroidales bacterium]
MKSNTNLEQEILDAATELFLERGFDSTSTTDIAKKAGCNQALVHYYFRTKENLFLRIFKKNIETFLSFANNYMYSGDFMQFLEKGIESYFEILKANRNLPLFLIKEFAMNEDRRIFFRENFVNNELRRSVYYKFDKIVKQEIEKGTIRPIETLNLLLDVLSLCAFTFISLPMYTTWLEKDDSEVDDFIESRKNEIITLIKNGLIR